MVNETQTENTSIDISTSSVTPEEPRDDSGDNETHQKNEPGVVSVLPPYNGVPREVAHISDTRSATRLKHHPANM